MTASVMYRKILSSVFGFGFGYGSSWKYYLRLPRSPVDTGLGGWFHSDTNLNQNLGFVVLDQLHDTIPELFRNENRDRIFHIMVHVDGSLVRLIVIDYDCRGVGVDGIADLV